MVYMYTCTYIYVYIYIHMHIGSLIFLHNGDASVDTCHHSHIHTHTYTHILLARTHKHMHTLAFIAQHPYTHKGEDTWLPINTQRRGHLIFLHNGVTSMDSSNLIPSRLHCLFDFLFFLAHFLFGLAIVCVCMLVCMCAYICSPISLSAWRLCAPTLSFSLSLSLS